FGDESLLEGVVAQSLFSRLAPQELPDLAADGVHGTQQALVRDSNAAAVEREHADGSSFGHDPKEEGAAHAALAVDLRFERPVVLRRIRGPQWLPALPHLAG